MTENGVAKVLVVDDELELRQLLTDALSAEDMEVTSAATATEAMQVTERERVDFIVTDLRLPDCTGLDILDDLRKRNKDIPAVVITGYGDAETFSQASRRRPVELMTKPLDIDRLRSSIREELTKRDSSAKWRLRAQRMRRVAHKMNRQRKHATGKLETTCAELTGAYRALCGQMSFQEALLGYQRDLLAAGNNDDVFRTLFRLFVQRTGALFGVSLTCGDPGELRIVGRFGVPQPDSLKFCEMLTWPIVEAVMVDPQCVMMDLTEDQKLFDVSIRKYLTGVNVLAIPLKSPEGEPSGLVILYRKGEQPFTQTDEALAEAISSPTAMAIKRGYEV
jgi:DNA-binding response OmpR family regulator